MDNMQKEQLLKNLDMIEGEINNKEILLDSTDTGI